MEKGKEKDIQISKKTGKFIRTNRNSKFYKLDEYEDDFSYMHGDENFLTDENGKYFVVNGEKYYVYKESFDGNFNKFF